MSANKSFKVMTAEERNGIAKLCEIAEKIENTMNAKPRQKAYSFEISDETYNQCNGRVVNTLVKLYKDRGYIVTINDRVLTIVRPTATV